MVNAPLLKPPVGVPIVTSPATLPVRSPVTSPVTLPVTAPVSGPTKLPDVTIPDNTNAVETPTSRTVTPAPTPAAMNTLPSAVLIANSPTSREFG